MRGDPAAHKGPTVFATHSTHKLLAGISQASQILCQESETRKLDRHIFNEAYLMHTSTSPQYAIIASCDVSAAMMEAPGGPALVEESILEALDTVLPRLLPHGDISEFNYASWFPDGKRILFTGLVPGHEILVNTGRIAERIATLDLVSGGVRARFGARPVR